MPSKPLPPEDHILRYAGKNRLHFDGETVLGLLPQAFKLRPDEKHLSVTWIEFFKGEQTDQIIQAIQTFRNSMQVGAQSAFGIANVGRCQDACRRAIPPANVRILHEPEEKNPAHVAIRRYPPDNQDLQEILAAEVFAEFVLNRDIPKA